MQFSRLWYVPLEISILRHKSLLGSPYHQMTAYAREGFDSQTEWHQHCMGGMILGVLKHVKAHRRE